MSLFSALGGLWKRAPAWRYSVFGAAIATVLAVMTAGGSNQPSSGNTVQGTSPTPPLAPPSNQQTQSCGPQGQTTVSAPIVVSNTGQVPSNVNMPQGGQTQSGGMPAAVQARFVQFITRVDAAAKDGRLGETCVKMDGAVDILEPTDYAYSDCFSNGPEKLVRAQQCSSDLAASEDRFDRLQAAYKAVQSDRSGPLLEQLSLSRDSMTDFDRYREKWQTVVPLIRAGDDAAAEITASDARIKRLENVSASLSAQPSPSQLVALASAGKLTALDRARLTAQQQALLTRAGNATEILSESDRRFAALAAAASTAAGADAASRDALIRAVSQLTSLDVARATPEQSAQIDAARLTAASFAMGDLVAGVQNFQPGSSPPSEFVKLRDLRRLLMRQGGIEAPTPQQTEALNIAQSAEIALNQSDLRLDRMREIVAQVDQGGPSELGDTVVQTHAEISPFDVARMSAEDQRVYGRLVAAKDVTLATEERLLTLDVPLFLEADRSDRWLAYALDLLTDDLMGAGFNVVTAREQSAVTFKLTRSDIEIDEVKLSGSNIIRSAKLSLGLNGVWTLAGDAIQVPDARGDAVSGSEDELSREALAEAVDGIVVALEELTEGN